MTAIGIIGIIFAVCLASMIELCILIITVNKMIDQKMRTKVELELQGFKAETEYFDKTIDRILAGIQECFKKS